MNAWHCPRCGQYARPRERRSTVYYDPERDDLVQAKCCAACAAPDYPDGNSARERAEKEPYEKRERNWDASYYPSSTA